MKGLNSPSDDFVAVSRVDDFGRPVEYDMVPVAPLCTDNARFPGLKIRNQRKHSVSI